MDWMREREERESVGGQMSVNKRGSRREIRGRGKDKERKMIQMSVNKWGRRIEIRGEGERERGERKSVMGQMSVNKWGRRMAMEQNTGGI
jgi:hypothetical protein